MAASDVEIKRDEHGDLFRDFGFLARAEELKAKGGADFKSERYSQALLRYKQALKLVLVVAQDKSMTLGQKKWDEVVVLRSILHLNMSTCHFKLKDYQEAASSTVLCLTGKPESTGGPLCVEERLPKPTQAKAHFRLAQCYAHLGFTDRAKQAAKAARCDAALHAEIDRFVPKIEALHKQQLAQQRKQLRGFWEKLENQGGYMSKCEEERCLWDGLGYEEKQQQAQILDDSDTEQVKGKDAKECDLARLDLDAKLARLSPHAKRAAKKVDERRRWQEALDMEE